MRLTALGLGRPRPRAGPRTGVRRAAIALLLASLLGPSATADAAPGARLVDGASVDALGSRVLTVRSTLVPAGRRVTFHVQHRRLGRSWSASPRRSVRGRGRRAVTVTLSGLRPAAAYGVRVVATTCGGCPRGTVRTRERLFRMPPERALVPAEPPPLGPAMLPPSRDADVTPADAASATSASDAPSTSATAAEPAPAPAPTPTPPSDGTFRNAIWSAWEFPDPTVIRVGSAYYAYATGDRFQVMRSKDLVTWEWLGTALPSRPAWAVTDGNWHPWAPSVLPTDAPCPGATTGECFVLYYVALSARFGNAVTNCVGVATSATPEGPFTDRGPLEGSDRQRSGGWPAGCGDSAGYGNIDPHPFVDGDGQAWLYVSTDWKCTDACRLLPEISVMPLSADGLSASGGRTPLLAGRAGTWEQAPWAPVVENPWVLERDGVFHMLYSGGSWQGAYAMGHATAASPTGPFTRSSPDPWTGSTGAVRSMGGGMIVRDGAGGEWLAYHGRDKSLDLPRTLRIDRLSWTADGRPRIEGPSTDPRPAPTP